MKKASLTIRGLYMNKPQHTGSRYLYSKYPGKLVSSVKLVVSLFILLLNTIHSFTQETRDPYQWPYSESSIWNTPIGTGAEYVPQPVDPNHIDGTHADLDIIILKPDAPGMNLYGTEYRWSSETNNDTRCQRYNYVIHKVLPIPRGYKTLYYKQSRPNNPGLILKRDNRTLFQTQPFQVCNGEYATSGLRRPYSNNILLTAPEIDLFGDGRVGMHGGSGLNTMGGAIRLGELLPGAPPMRHALKISFPGEYYLYFDHDKGNGHRWPAVQHDSGAKDDYNGSNPHALQGCLRAIPVWIDIDTLELKTEAGRRLAWTLQNFGAYQVEGVPWSRMMIAVEEGPDGSVVEEFEEVYGYEFATKDKENNPWFQDCMKLMPLLHIVANNVEKTPGGGGTPLAEKAPPFGRAGNEPPAISLIVSEYKTSQNDSVSLEALAYDADGSVDHVKFFINDSLFAIDSIAPYMVKISETNNTSLRVIAGATDNEGRYSVSFPFIFNPQQFSPSQIDISWTDIPPDSVDMGKPITLKVYASMDQGTIKQVNFYDGMRLVHTDYTSPYEFMVNHASDNFYKFSAKAISVDNHEQRLPQKIIKVINTENDLPVIDMKLNVKDSLFVTNSLTVFIEAFDPDGDVKNIDLYLNNEIVRTSYKPSMLISIDTLSIGIHELQAYCYDNQNELSISEVFTIRVIEDTTTKLSSDYICQNELFNVFPNPLKWGEKLNIKFSSELAGLNKSVILFDGLGKMIYEQNTVNSFIILPPPQLGKGIYLLLIKTENKTFFSEKIIYEK